MEAQTKGPLDATVEARQANERLRLAQQAFASAQTELIQAERAARDANRRWLHTIFPDFY